MTKKWRRTGQYLLPEKKPEHPEGTYDIYPSFKLVENQIFQGFESIADIMSKYPTVIIDGYIGVYYDSFRKKLDEYFYARSVRTSWQNTTDFLKSPERIEQMTSPFMGRDDPLFGKHNKPWSAFTCRFSAIPGRNI